MGQFLVHQWKLKVVSKGVAQNIYDTRIHTTTWVEFMIWQLKSLAVQKLST